MVSGTNPVHAKGNEMERGQCIEGPSTRQTEGEKDRGGGGGAQRKVDRVRMAGTICGKRSVRWYEVEEKELLLRITN